MPFAAALSTQTDAPQAVAEICQQIQSQFTGTPDLAMLYYSPHHLRAVSTLAAEIQTRLQPRCLLGCPGETIIANEQEIENSPALSLWLGRWNRPVQLTPFAVYLERTSEGMSLLGWPDALVGVNPAQAVILTLADPYTFPIDVFLQTINEEYPGLRVLGGMASGTRGAGHCRMLLDGKQIDQGAVAVLLEGAPVIRSVVSQGCRPIGRPLVITRASENVIHELGGRTPLDQLRELWSSLSVRDQELMQQGLHIGRVINEYQQDFQRGDFLVRNVMGLERDTGALIITDPVRLGQTVQFHIRDADSADEDLHALLQTDRAAQTQSAAGALLFSCNGRGTRLFSQPHHDAQAIRGVVGPIPLAGFFAQGEIGPIGGKNFIHGFTASVVLFEE